jgi:heme-degrading monooxygenase HmoA
MNEEHRIVAIVRFKVTPEDFSRVSSEADTTLQRRLPTVPGFIEGMVLANEGSTKVCVVSEWKSRQNWAAAQWDGDIERTVADLFQDTASYELEMYFPLAEATAATIGQVKDESP